jgi:type IV secretory pathway protease TraF
MERDILASDLQIGRNSYYINPFKIPRRGDIITDTVQALCHSFVTRDQIGKKLDDDFYYLVGDNRFNSNDSRFIGLVPRKAITGVVKIQP